MKQELFDTIQRLNTTLSSKFGISDLQDRMVFIACALVVQRYGTLPPGQCLGALSNYILCILQNTRDGDNQEPLQALADAFSLIRPEDSSSTEDMTEFVDAVTHLFNYVNSADYQGEDIMAVMFSEFNRKKGKSDAGQVFTPDHICGFICRILGVGEGDCVIDTACGSGSLLTKASKYCGVSNVYGVELYNKVYLLACANILMHKGSICHIKKLDATSDDTAAFIRESEATLAILNPPYERKYHCSDIVCNVLDNVKKGTKCAFILPDKKFEKESKLKKCLKRHSLRAIIKLPEDLFFGVGVSTSIFILEAGEPQNESPIIGYHIQDDGFVTVKNKGRHDVNHRWTALCNYWVEAIKDGDDVEYNTRQIIDPEKSLSYQIPEKPFEIYEEDFVKCVMDYEMYKRGIDIKKFKENLLDAVLYSSEVIETSKGIMIMIQGGTVDAD